MGPRFKHDQVTNDRVVRVPEERSKDALGTLRARKTMTEYRALTVSTPPSAIAHARCRTRHHETSTLKQTHPFAQGPCMIKPGGQRED